MPTQLDTQTQRLSQVDLTDESMPPPPAAQPQPRPSRPRKQKWQLPRAPEPSNQERNWSQCLWCGITLKNGNGLMDRPCGQASQQADRLNTYIIRVSGESGETRYSFPLLYLNEASSISIVVVALALFHFMSRRERPRRPSC